MTPSLFLVNPNCNIKTCKTRYKKYVLWNLKWLGAKFYEKLIKVKHLCAHMDISIEENRNKPVRLWRTLILYYYERHRITACISYRLPNLVFSQGRGALIWRGNLFQILSLSRGANSNSFGRDFIAEFWVRAFITGCTPIFRVYNFPLDYIPKFWVSECFPRGWWVSRFA